jgi:hypothetical protein
MIDYKIFYNEEFNMEYSTRKDFVKWKKNEFSYCQYPFLLQPDIKSNLLQYDSLVIQQEYQEPLIFMIRRDKLTADSIDFLNAVSFEPERLLSDFKIIFQGEEGIDEGGPKKEWFQLLVSELFNLDYGMFIPNDDSHTYWFNPNNDQYSQYKLLGAVMGLAFYNGVILDIRFPLVVYKKLLNITLSYQDLKEVNLGIYDGITNILEYEGDISEWEIYFETMVNHDSSKRPHKLIENGDNILVTNENKFLYIEAMINFILKDSIKLQYDNFYEGFMMVCDKCTTLPLFIAEELQLLIVGSEDLNFKEMQEGCRYENFEEDDATVQFFWEVLFEYDLEKKKKFLSFTTGSDRSPIGGLKNLGLVIMKHGSVEHLPTAHTCFNHILLPPYESKLKLQEKLDLAIENTVGFGLK